MNDWRRGVVRVWQGAPHQNGCYLGTAFLVSPNHLLTGRHVIEGIHHRELRLDGPPWSGLRTVWQEPALHPERDIAVLTLVDSHPDAAPIALAEQGLKVGEEVILAGYGTPDQDLETPPLTIHSYDGDHHTFALHTYVATGMSGGPALRGGRLVGVTQARDSDKNRSYIIPLDAFREFLAAIVGSERMDNPFIAYRRGRIAEWSKESYALDKRFVQLTLLLDQGEQAEGPRWAAQPQRFRDLGELLAAVREPAFVLLGPPGSGKSTLLRRFELDCAMAGEVRHAVTFFISLNQYPAAQPGLALPKAMDWLAGRWAEQFPDMPKLDELLRQGRMILLLDALNEMPLDREQGSRLWKAFLADLPPGNRVIFSCRSLDYSASLSAKDSPVPQARIESLDDSQVREFLHCYSQQGEELWEKLKKTAQLELFRSPYFLKLLVQQAGEGGDIPQGRAALFTGLVRKALKREVDGDNPLFHQHDLLDEQDCLKVIQDRWRFAGELPPNGILFERISTLAYRMQAMAKPGENVQVRVNRETALQLLEQSRGEAILQAGVALGVLDIDPAQDEVRFVHQLLQEYFAARHLAQMADYELARTGWKAHPTPWVRLLGRNSPEVIQPSLEQTLTKLADSDPLPPAPATGWEETFVLAAALTKHADEFVEKLMAVNLPLSGRCAAQGEANVTDGLKTRIRRALIARTKDPEADLRSRIAAGNALGVLGDPRFERLTGPYGDYLLPPMVEIQGGSYPMGSDGKLYADEAPAHTVRLEPFAIGRFPVTNAEWRRFMDAGGYEDERWWQTEDARAWRRGEAQGEGAKADVRELRRSLQANPEQIHTWLQERQFTTQQAQTWDQLIAMGDEDFETVLDQTYPSGRQTQPGFWNDTAYNHPAQPVVGVTWFEARAYCAWLSARSGKAFRLPGEAEWEAAASGKLGRTYPWGKGYDASRANTFETHVRRITPVGVFPLGTTPEGVADMSGNVWEWTSSLYRDYPYRAEDGREEAESSAERRVLRGGSWYSNPHYARVAYRSGFHPDFRVNCLGFRLVCAVPIADL